MAPDEVDIRYMSDLASLLESRCRSVSLVEVLRVIDQVPPSQVRCAPPTKRERLVALRMEITSQTWASGPIALVLWREPDSDPRRAKSMLRRLLCREDVGTVLLVTPHPEHRLLPMDMGNLGGGLCVAVVKEEAER